MKAYYKNPRSNLYELIFPDKGCFFAAVKFPHAFQDDYLYSSASSSEFAKVVINRAKSKPSDYMELELDDTLVQQAIALGKAYYPHSESSRGFKSKAKELFAEAERLLYEEGILLSA